MAQFFFDRIDLELRHDFASIQWHWSIMSSYCATATNLMQNAKPSQLYVENALVSKRKRFTGAAIQRALGMIQNTGPDIFELFNVKKELFQ